MLDNFGDLAKLKASPECLNDPDLGVVVELSQNLVCLLAERLLVCSVTRECIEAASAHSHVSVALDHLALEEGRVTRHQNHPNTMLRLQLVFEDQSLGRVFDPGPLDKRIPTERCQSTMVERGGLVPPRLLEHLLVSIRSQGGNNGSLDFRADTRDQLIVLLPQVSFLFGVFGALPEYLSREIGSSPLEVLFQPNLIVIFSLDEILQLLYERSDPVDFGIGNELSLVLKSVEHREPAVKSAHLQSLHRVQLLLSKAHHVAVAHALESPEARSQPVLLAELKRRQFDPTPCTLHDPVSLEAELPRLVK